MTQTLTIDRWVPADLLNVRRHWSGHAKAKAEASQMVWASAKEAGWQPQPGKVHLKVHFTFPEKRRRDIDNLTARCKGICDGLKRGFIEDDDMEHLTLAVSASVERGVKQLRITLEGLEG